MLKVLMEKLKWLDPFTYVDLYVLPAVNPGKSKAIETIVYIFSAFVFAYVLYNFILAGLLGTATPLVIVFSGSMEPTLYRGDVVVLSKARDLHLNEAELDFTVKDKLLSEYAQIGYSLSADNRLKPAALKIEGKDFLLDSKGPIVVYTSGLRGQDIIHRAVLLLKAKDGDFLVTLGDNNTRIDQDCVESRGSFDCISLRPVAAQSLKGKYVFHIPLVGYAKLLVFDDLPAFLARLAGKQN